MAPIAPLSCVQTDPTLSRISSFTAAYKHNSQTSHLKYKVLYGFIVIDHSHHFSFFLLPAHSRFILSEINFVQKAGISKPLITWLSCLFFKSL